MATMRAARWLGTLLSMLTTGAGATFEVSTSAVGYSNSAVATDGSGVTLVVWAAGNPPESVVGQRFDASGDPVGPPMQVSTTPGGLVQSVTLGQGAGGQMVVAWMIQDGDYHVRARPFDPVGNPFGTEVEIATETLVPITIGVGVDPTGAFLVAWSSFGSLASDAADDAVLARHFNAAGMPTAALFQVNTSPASSAAVDVVYTGTQYVVAWSGTSEDTLRAQRIDDSGNPVGTEITVAADAQGVSLDADGAGNFVVTAAVLTAVVRAWRYDGAGNLLDTPIDVGTELTYVFNANVAVAPSGAFVVAWAGLPGVGTADTRVRVRRYDGAGLPLDGEREITPAGERNGAPAIDVLPPGGFFATWTREAGAPGTVQGLAWRPEAPVRGKVLQMSDPASATGVVVKLTLKDPLVATIPGAGLDPLGSGVSIQVFRAGGSGDSACVDLPSDAWTSRPTRRFPRWQYTDTQSAFGPCRKARAIDGEIKISCKGTVQPFPYTLDEPSQGAVAVRVTSGHTTYCAEFGGQVKKDEPGTFRAKLAARSASCAAPPPCP